VQISRPTVAKVGGHVPTSTPPWTLLWLRHWLKACFTCRLQYHSWLLYNWSSLYVQQTLEKIPERPWQLPETFHKLAAKHGICRVPLYATSRSFLHTTVIVAKYLTRMVNPLTAIVKNPGNQILAQHFLPITNTYANDKIFLVPGTNTNGRRTARYLWHVTWEISLQHWKYPVCGG